MANNIRSRIIQLIDQTLSDIGNNVIDLTPSLQRLEVARDLTIQMFNIEPNRLERQLGHRDINSIQEADTQKLYAVNDLESALLNIDNAILSQHIRHAIHRLDLVNDFNHRNQ